MRWRWDQGRLDYFRFDTIKRVATVLCTLENADLRTGQDTLRSSLEAATGLLFAPDDYKVWRNYKRVFGCCLLAAEVDHRMVCTELCHKLATDNANEISADVYFGHFVRRFYHHSPVFEGYVNRGIQTFPGCAILKLLLARLRSGQQAVVTIDEIVSLLVANGCTGREAIASYASLRPRANLSGDDEVRQIRELCRFISQLSFLKWVQPRIYLDVDPQNSEGLHLIETLAQPIIRERHVDASRELLSLGATGDLGVVAMVPVSTGNLYFSEGKPMRVSHLRYERSPKLREMFFREIRPPFICDMCTHSMSRCYPWAENLLELHHLLPLASPLRVETQRTSLSQLVAVCPNCHKATHIFYRNWIDDHGQEDFATYEEAASVYQQAKNDARFSTN